MKKGVKIAIAAAAVIAVLGGAGFYLSQTVIKYDSIERAFPDIHDIIEPYPYADMEVPAEFRACSIKGIDFMAPDGLHWLYPDEEEGVKSGIIVDEDDPEKRTLLVCVMDKEDDPIIDNSDLEDQGFFNKRMLKGMKKLGYEKPENFHDLDFLVNTFRIEDCNKFSISEVSAVYDLAMLKGILAPAMLSYGDKDHQLENAEPVETKRYYYDTDTMKSFIMQGAARNGAYELNLTVYDVNDLNRQQDVIIISNEPDTARQIAKTVQIAEE